MIGDILFGLALMWWVVETTGSGLAMSASALASGLPRILLGPFAGVLADRFDRRNLMFATNAVGALITLSMVFLYVNGIFSLGLIIGAAAALGATAAVHSPCFEATIPSIVDATDLTRANSLFQTSRSVAGIVAPAVSGIIIAVFGIGASIFIDSLTFIFAGLSLLLVSLPSPKVVSQQGLLRQSTEGFRFIFDRRLLFSMLLFFAVINLTLAPLGIALPMLILQVMAAGPALYGTFGSSQSLGVLVGSSLLTAFPRLSRNCGLLVVICIITGGASIMVLGLWPNPMVLIGAGFFLGFSIVIAQISSQYIWQRETPDEVRGRVFAARFTFSAALQPVGLGVAGPVIDLIGPARLLSLGGGLCAACGFLGFLVPGLVSYKQATE
jgi:MFS family permease